jgi:asparagine synthase (glutamine-hydrolysing)
MCGFAGYIDLRDERRAEMDVLIRMMKAIAHRGPDSSDHFIEKGTGLGFQRLSIIDLESGDQPLYNEDGSVVLLCNGEIFNYKELKKTLVDKGHRFRSNTDVEVLLHLYEEEGAGFLNKLNGQFAFVIYDRKTGSLMLARDHFGINPLYYTQADGLFIFASEIKAILEHPAVHKEVDLLGLDQLLSFPGLVSPRTMFKGIESLKSGHYILIEKADLKLVEYWDLDYPNAGELPYAQPEQYYVERLKELFANSVRRRLQADVPVGFYLSGGLDSSLIAAMIKRVSPGVKRHSFSVIFDDKEINEAKYQRLMANHVNSEHHEILFDWTSVAERLSQAVYHSESPLKETYNTASLALSKAAREAGISVVLNGEGADELFAGYVGYRFDQFRAARERRDDFETIMEDEMRERLWGDADLYYEKDQYAFKEVKAALYSSEVNRALAEADGPDFELVNKSRVCGRHFVHQRSYLDFKIRLAGHLIADHGDRMAMAHSVEARYPFLDIELVEFSREIPPELKLNLFTEKYVLKKVADGLLPREITRREKFAFVTSGSPHLLRQGVEWVNDVLSFERVKRQGYFNPDAVEALKAQYTQPDFKLGIPVEDDFLTFILTFGLLLQLFDLPDIN